MHTWDFILRLGVALLLGGAVGFERQWRQKSAGLRTNTLVSVGAAAYILFSLYLNTAQGGDAGRVAAQIVTGIGFLGAGVIMKDGLSVQGLNTAATIWCSAAVGCFVGMGLFPEAVLVTSAIVLTHLLMRPVSDQLSKISSYKKEKKGEFFYKLAVVCADEQEAEIRGSIRERLDASDKYLLRSITRKRLENEDEVLLTLVLSTVGRQEAVLEEMVQEVTDDFEVRQAGWTYIQEPEA